MAGPSLGCPRKRVLGCKPSTVMPRSLAMAKKMTPKNAGKRIIGTIKSSILQFGYRSSVVRSGETDYAQVVHSALKKFDDLQTLYPKLNPFQILKMMKERYPQFILNRDHREGSIPGVEVGDFFGTRAELWIVGLHRYTQAGIDWIEFLRKDGVLSTKAVSIVVSGEYEDDQDDGETLIYTGEGGNRSKKQRENQELKRGTVALNNSKFFQNSIRVIRCRKDERSRTGRIYSYDGLYKIVSGMKEKGKSGFDVFKYKLVRESGQKPLVWPPSPVGYHPNGETIMREGLQEELENEGSQEPAQSSENLLKSFLGPAGRLKSAVATSGDGKEMGGSNVGRGETSVENGGHGKGDGLHRGLKRRFEDDLSGVAAKPAISLGDGKAYEIENRIKRKKEDTTGASQEASNTSRDAEGPEVEVERRAEDGDEDGEEDEPLVFPRLKLRARGEPSVMRRNLVVDDLEEEKFGVRSTRGDLHVGNKKVFENVKQEESDDMTKELSHPKRRISTRPKSTQNERVSVKLLHDNVTKRNERLRSNWCESDGDKNSKRDLRKCEVHKAHDNLSKNDTSKMDEDEYEVECILKRRPGYGSRDRDVEEYLILWKGYSREEATWEPRENLIKCEEALENFEHQLERRNCL